MPPSMPQRLGCRACAPCGLCCGAACCCAGFAGVDAGGAVTLRCAPTERPPPRRAASASAATTIAPSINADSMNSHFFIADPPERPMLSNPDPSVDRHHAGGEVEHLDVFQ